MPLYDYLAAFRPSLPRDIAAFRLRRNGLLLTLYVWIWALPGYYRYFKMTIIDFVLFVPLFPRRWLLSLVSFMGQSARARHASLSNASHVQSYSCLLSSVTM